MNEQNTGDGKRVILMIDTTESYGRNLIRGISRYSDVFGPWSLCKMPLSFKEKNGIKGLIEFARNWGAHGIIGRFYTQKEVRQLVEAGLYLIAIDYKELFNEISNISGDYQLSGRMAAEYFLSKGYKNFGYYGTMDTVWSREREVGFNSVLNKKGFKVERYAPKAFSTDNFWYYNLNPLIEWLEDIKKPAALFTCDDNRAEHILEAAKIAKISVPEELAILGVDNDEVICRYTNPTLSSIQQNEEIGGYQAAQLMDEMIRSNTLIKQDIVLESVQIITRQSSDISAISDEHVKAALAYIQDHLGNNITVGDLLPVAGLSRRALEKRFMNVLGRSVYKEVQRQRMERVITLLLESDLSINEISMKCGYTDSKNLSRLFSSLHHVTPLQYRKKHQFINRTP